MSLTIKPAQFRDNLFAAFATFWAGRTPVAYPNVQFRPETVAGDAWVELQLVGDDAGRTEIGSSEAGQPASFSGTLGISIYVRMGQGTDLAYDLAEAAVAFMEAPRNVPNTLLRDISAPQEIGPDGVWWQVNVTCTFVYFSDRV